MTIDQVTIGLKQSRQASLGALLVILNIALAPLLQQMVTYRSISVVSNQKALVPIIDLWFDKVQFSSGGTQVMDPMEDSSMNMNADGKNTPDSVSVSMKSARSTMFCCTSPDAEPPVDRWNVRRQRLIRSAWSRTLRPVLPP